MNLQRLGYIACILDKASIIYKYKPLNVDDAWIEM